MQKNRDVSSNTHLGLVNAWRRREGIKNQYVFPCWLTVTTFSILDLETDFCHPRQYDLLAELVQLVPNTRPVGTPEKLQNWIQTQKLSLISTYKLGWSPSWRDNIAVDISRKAPSKTQELAIRETQGGSSCIIAHKPHCRACRKRKNHVILKCH